MTTMEAIFAVTNEVTGRYCCAACEQIREINSAGYCEPCFDKELMENEYATENR
jgi:hypothetical protein